MSGLALTTEQIWHDLGQIPDPEMPALSIVDLGVVRAVRLTAQDCVVTMTPTYSGCPALEMMQRAVRERLLALGCAHVDIQVVLAPAWSSDWLSDAARAQLVRDGIAAPHPVALMKLGKAPSVPCPRCASARTGVITQFSGTACKALYRCLDCLEPFDYFKPH